MKKWLKSRYLCRPILLSFPMKSGCDVGRQVQQSQWELRDVFRSSFFNAALLVHNDAVFSHRSALYSAHLGFHNSRGQCQSSVTTTMALLMQHFSWNFGILRYAHVLCSVRTSPVYVAARLLILFMTYRYVKRFILSHFAIVTAFSP